MNSIAKKKIVVFPAGGWQGRSVCAALASNPRYDVVGIVRNLESPKLNMGGIDLKRLNIKLVQGDFKDPASYRQHLVGAYGAFVNTDFWSIWGENGCQTAKGIETELEYGRNIIAEAHKADVQHFVFSSLFQGTKTIPEGSYIWADRKLNDVLRESGMPYTIYYSSGYYENLIHLGMIQPQEDGSIKLAFMCPDATTQMFTSSGTVGAFVAAIFADRERFLGKEVLNSTVWQSWGDMATKLAELSGKKVTTSNITDEQWNGEALKSSMGEFWNIFNSLYTSSIKVHFDGTTGTDVVKSLPTFEEWAKADSTIKQIFGI